ncbi:hypothetical protein EMIHUDRAFT_249046 [Emiliania huxleyi CCMP1516]|uniref:Uncharacterized protein n=2 Tax=Emiliania huxleyi TaxID=2903 RepID=A0A0D3IB60_EMIH1|nr:hypothetical protein EMIHUDRAFT_249046 [Emiliania huxleyi CCMP1516]EOD08495.1 hypothetical protein EMIHUDRAFT_249046 [Emiliania huxleyi CCMP1516]|eukprot:XP_005760924.1 hypothetical protein EMIHUDRAFT_249046 [Emiliania huxleyi CCMP1516]
MPRWLLAKPPTGVTPAAALQERAGRFFAGDFELLWDAHKRATERERGEELVTFIQDAARKRRLGQAVPSVPPGDLAHAQLRQLLCADVTTAERATMLRWRRAAAGCVGAAVSAGVRKSRR